jgi:hypothetical protein
MLLATFVTVNDAINSWRINFIGGDWSRYAGSKQLWPSMQYYTSICLEGSRKAKKISLEMVGVPFQIQNGHFHNTRKMCHCFASVHLFYFFIMYLMSEDGQNGCNVYYVLKGLIKLLWLMSIYFFLWYVFAFMCTNYTNIIQWTIVWALITLAAMKHWPHILKLVVCFFSPSNPLEIKGEREKKNEMPKAS